MKIIALLSWYEESPSWLASLVASLKGVVDHIVAVDGAYMLFPDARPYSGAEQADAIWLASQAAGIGCSLHHPTEVWRGNEVEKRCFLARAGELVAEPWVDWYLWLDADDFVMKAPLDLHARLTGSDKDVGEITLYWRDDWIGNSATERVAREMELPEMGETWGRVLMRAIPGLRVEHAHMIYVAEKDGRKIWLRGRTDVHALEDAESVIDMRIEHRHNWRSASRAALAEQYYELRDLVGAEKLPEGYWEKSKAAA